MDAINFVYLLTFSNGKVYVGMSKTDKTGRFDLRYNNHAFMAKKGKQLPVYNAWRKHGAPKQEILSLHENRMECALAEIDAIEKYDSTNPKHGYNITKGGEGQDSATNPIMYEVMRRKVWNNPKWREKVSDALKGRQVSEATRKAHAEFRKTPEFKQCLLRGWQNEERKRKASERTKSQMQNGGAEHLSKIFKGKPDTRSQEGKKRTLELAEKWRQTEEGKAALKRGAKAAWSNPETREKCLAGLDKWRNSERNKEQCAKMAKLSAEACSIKVMDNQTGIVYNSQREMARALGVSEGCISLRVKSGKVTRV